MKRAQKINVLNQLKDGSMSIAQLKKIMQSKEQGGKLVDPYPEGLQTRIPIKTDYNYIYLGYPPAAGYGMENMKICIASRTDPRFKQLDCDTEYMINIPAPGILVEDLPRYHDHMEFSHEINSKDYIW